MLSANFPQRRQAGGELQFSTAVTTSGGTTRFQRSASPRSMMKVRPTMEVSTSAAMKKMSRNVVIVDGCVAGRNRRRLLI